MAILRIDVVRREIGDFVILDSVSASLAHGERVGLVGANGAGKTTLLEIVAGREEPDGGSVHVARGIRVGLLAQEANLDQAIVGAHTVRSAVRSGAVLVEGMERELATLEAGGAEAVQSATYASLRERFEALDGYHLDQRVEMTLAGLGIPSDDWARPPRELSGGEQTRVALARLLVEDPELLMLDEPTNHLDIGALEWLEVALARRPGALVVASHDRAFLDNVVTRIWEVRDRRLRTFRGAYSAYLLQREAADARQRMEAETSRDAMTREQELVSRYRSQRKHVKMHEHERRLEALREAAVDAPRRSAHLVLPGAGRTRVAGTGPARSGDMVVSLQDLVCGFVGVGALGTPTPIARVERLEAMRGDRIGLVGPNGVGKTTLLRTIAGDLPAIEGFVRIGANVQAGYLAQLRDQPLPGATVLDVMLAASHLDAGPARAHLARFLFRGDEVQKPVAELSGGERSRLELALLGVGTANLLLLDEPTNHLDIPAREALEMFLRDTSATLIVVSHDRRLLETVCRRLWVVDAGAAGGPSRVAPYDGGYRAWRDDVAQGWTAAAELARRNVGRPPMGTGTVTATSAASRSNGAHARPSAKRQPPLSKDAHRRQQQRVEEDLTRLGLRKSQLELTLGDPGVQTNFVELRRLSSELADVDAALGQAEDAWLALAERAPR